MDTGDTKAYNMIIMSLWAALAQRCYKIGLQHLSKDMSRAIFPNNEWHRQRGVNFSSSYHTWNTKSQMWWQNHRRNLLDIVLIPNMALLWQTVQSDGSFVSLTWVLAIILEQNHLVACPYEHRQVQNIINNCFGTPGQFERCATCDNFTILAKLGTLWTSIRHYVPRETSNHNLDARFLCRSVRGFFWYPSWPGCGNGPKKTICFCLWVLSMMTRVKLKISNLSCNLHLLGFQIRYLTLP